MCFFSIVKVVVFDRIIGPQSYCADKKTVGPYCVDWTRKLMLRGGKEKCDRIGLPSYCTNKQAKKRIFSLRGISRVRVIL